MRGTQNIAGDPCFSQIDEGRENTVGDSKNPAGDVQGELPRGLFYRGVVISTLNLVDILIAA